MHSNNYLKYGVTDFVADDSFIKHHLAPTERSTQFWTNWLSQNPQKQADWDAAQQLLQAVLLGLDDYARTYLSEEKQAWLFQRIQQTNAALATETPLRPVLRRAWIWRAAAAAACFLMAFGFWFFQKSVKTPPSVYEQQIANLEQKTTEYSNSTDKPMQIDLPDGSVIHLAPKSRLSYPADFGQTTRTVFLSGEASFDIAKDAKKPFYAYANEVVTKVLGTRFVINAFEKDKNVTVSVQSGQVSVYRPEEKADAQTATTKVQGVLLLPNQQAVFERQTAQFKKTLVATPIMLQNTEGGQNLIFEFNETPVVEALERIKKAYGINLVYNVEALKECQITASLTQVSLFQKLKIISEIIGGNYETVEGEIVITAEGCKE